MYARIDSWRERIKAAGPLAVLNLVVLLAAVGVFVYLAVSVARSDHPSFDEQIIRALRTGETLEPIGPHWMEEVARDITALGSVVVLTGLTLLATAFLALSRRLGAALFLITAALGGQTLNAGLKAYYGRDRPDEIFRLIEIDSMSFPSGHATSSAVIYLTFAVLLARLAPERSQKFYLIGSALLISFLVGLSRVYLGVHYPTDVIAGWAVGVVWAQICWFVARALGRRRLAKKTPKTADPENQTEA